VISGAEPSGLFNAHSAFSLGPSGLGIDHEMKTKKYMDPIHGYFELERL
jgi:hypothetical protein